MSPARFQPDDFIGEYILKELLGTGGFGEVWKAKMQGGKDFVALKVLKQEADIKSLVREQEALHKLEHPNIVKILGGELNHEPPYIVMEYVDAGSLEDLLKNRGRLPVSETLKIFHDVVAGVAHAHENGFIHRDLKPANILLGEGGEIKVCDFGLGRAAEKESLSISMATKHSGIVGTLEYMAPEQAEGQPGDERSDIYSLGRILFRMISGRLPAGMDESLVEFVTGGKATDLDMLFQGCCAAYQRRYPSAASLIKLIDIISSGAHLDSKIDKSVRTIDNSKGLLLFGSLKLKKATLKFNWGRNKRMITRIDLHNIREISWKEKYNKPCSCLIVWVIAFISGYLSILIGPIGILIGFLFFIIGASMLIKIILFRFGFIKKDVRKRRVIIKIFSSDGIYIFEEFGNLGNLEWFLYEVMKRAHQLGNKMTVKKI